MQILLYILFISFIAGVYAHFIMENDSQDTSCNILDSPDNINFNIILPVSKNFYHLEEKLLDISNPKSNNYRNYLSIDYIKHFSSPSEKIRKPVIDWINNNNLDCVDFGDSFKCKSTIKKAAMIWNLKSEW